MGASMLSFFSRRKASPISSNTATGFFKLESPDALLSTSRRRQLIENIWQRTSLPPPGVRIVVASPVFPKKA
ncbi:hypothetical protein [Pseudomonas syringae]|uniref:hypothetical protein n=1 Tax=Pseudomonas syringae TaxID=317 RepID=UPI00034B1FAA|nr:hypothetical protein [Pseudomonas syringae]